MKTNLNLKLLKMSMCLGLAVSASSAFAEAKNIFAPARACYSVCRFEHKACKKQKIASCDGNLECILGEFQDCRDVRQNCLDACDADAAKN